jgi:hypothetical protein
MRKLESLAELHEAYRTFLDKSPIKKYSEYKEYLESIEWKIKADYIKQERGFRCQMCNISGYVMPLHVHHNTYERLGHEKGSDLIVLCVDCHKIFHEHKKPQANKLELSEQEIKKILHFNGVSPKNDEAWDGYELGKHIIQHIIDGYNSEFYDKYNKVNIDILYKAIDRITKENEEE